MVVMASLCRGASELLHQIAAAGPCCPVIRRVFRQLGGDGGVRFTPTHTSRSPPALASAARCKSLQNTRINNNDKSWPVSYRPDSWVELSGGSGHQTGIQSPLRPARIPCIDGWDAGVRLSTGNAVGGSVALLCLRRLFRSAEWNVKA